MNPVARNEESLLFSTELVSQVRDIIIDHHRPPTNAVALPRVATPLLNVKPEAYIPDFVSIGPYHRSTLNKLDNVYRRLKVSTGEKYKLMCFETLSQNVHNLERKFGSIVQQIQDMRDDIESFYGQKISGNGDGFDFALMMGIDASFLLCSLTAFPLHLIALKTLYVSIECDILKLENQIPLCVLRAVYEHWTISYGSAPDFNEMLRTKCLEFCRFLFSQDYLESDPGTIVRLDGKRHLLDCMHTLFSPLLRLNMVAPDQQSGENFLECVVRRIGVIFKIRHPRDEGRHDFIKAYTAELLAKAGIKFKSFAEADRRIRFDRKSRTLFLPRITVSPIHTEVLLRNMLALEFNDEGGPKLVTRYVGLMDCLINTANDVRILRKCSVINRFSVMLSDERIAEMWNGMCQPFLIGQFEPEETLKNAFMDVIHKRYYKNKIKRFLWKCTWDPVSRAGKGVAIVAGILILLMTAIQTFCSLYGLVKHKT